MNFPEQLNCILVKEEKSDETSVDVTTELDNWNAEIEAFLSTPPPSDLFLEEVDELAMASLLQSVVFKLYRDSLRSSSCNLSLAAKLTKMINMISETLETLTQHANKDLMEQQKPPRNEKRLFMCV
jgi:hypothetical protein